MKQTVKSKSAKQNVVCQACKIDTHTAHASKPNTSQISNWAFHQQAAEACEVCSKKEKEEEEKVSKA